MNTPSLWAHASNGGTIDSFGSALAAALLFYLRGMKPTFQALVFEIANLDRVANDYSI